MSLFMVGRPPVKAQGDDLVHYAMVTEWICQLIGREIILEQPLSFLPVGDIFNAIPQQERTHHRGNNKPHVFYSISYHLRKPIVESIGFPLEAG